MLNVDVIYHTDKDGQPTSIAKSLCCDLVGGAPRKLHVLEPLSSSGDAQNIAHVLLEREKASAIFSSKDGRTSDAIAMLFNEQRHWRFVALVGKEKVHTQRLQPSSPRKYQLSASQASRKPSSLVWADALLLEPIRFPASA